MDVLCIYIKKIYVNWLVSGVPSRHCEELKQELNKTTTPQPQDKKCCTTSRHKSPQGNTFLFIPIILLIPSPWLGDKEMFKSAGTQEELWMNALVAPEDTKIFHKVNKRSIYRGEPWWCNEPGRRGRPWWITKKRMVKTSLARQNLVLEVYGQQIKCQQSPFF